MLRGKVRELLLVALLLLLCDLPKGLVGLERHSGGDCLSPQLRRLYRPPKRDIKGIPMQHCLTDDKTPQTARNSNDETS